MLPFITFRKFFFNLSDYKVHLFKELLNVVGFHDFHDMYSAKKLSHDRKIEWKTGRTTVELIYIPHILSSILCYKRK